MLAETSRGFELTSSSELCLYFIVVCSTGADYKLVDYMYFSVCVEADYKLRLNVMLFFVWEGILSMTPGRRYYSVKQP